eukprot:TRINITY_DN9863_c0_g1_i3.p1 TRINITY_DN9863_c0_g1~~TRINITY_DN9863_c0_g1_i3.p1  ORF type:complete len:315 (+),score=69.38 TRINITY_DN9863_c0_g1_i3:100-945(+)
MDEAVAVLPEVAISKEPIKQLLPTPFGYQLRSQPDGVFHWFYPRLIKYEWEPQSFAILDTCLFPETIFIDIGTWIAPLALYALTKPGVSVLGVEPDPVARQRCLANMAANEQELSCSTRMIVEPACISSKAGTVQFGNDDFGLGDSMSKMGIGELSVPCMTFAQLLDKHQVDLADVSLIKMDIEGGEEDALDNLVKSLSVFVLANGTLPALYLSFHVPNFKHPDATCSRIAQQLLALYATVVAVENGQTVHTEADVLEFMRGCEYGSLLCRLPKDAKAAIK